MLELDRLGGGYTRHDTIESVSLSVESGRTVALLGPNGAGKSTLLAAISGVLPRIHGSARVFGEQLVGLASHDIVARGIVQVPEGRRVFAPLSVEDNLRLGAVALEQRTAAAIRARMQWVHELFPRLAERRTQLAGTLSGGEQQMLAIGRALMSSPRVLLLDEPFLGLAPLIVGEIRRALDALKEQGLTMLLVEQKLDIALSFAEYAYVIIKGRIVLHERSSVLARRDDLASLYFQLSRDT
ncbi:MAG: ABC transporter ATP-binding protein [Betaproteobacteria bacterium]|jgi:branched-chain amino acid transport system ATP-binding protein